MTKTIWDKINTLNSWLAIIGIITSVAIAYVSLKTSVLEFDTEFVGDLVSSSTGENKLTVKLGDTTIDTTNTNLKVAILRLRCKWRSIPATAFPKRWGIKGEGIQFLEVKAIRASQEDLGDDINRQLQILNNEALFPNFNFNRDVEIVLKAIYTTPADRNNYQIQGFGLIHDVEIKSKFSAFEQPSFLFDVVRGGVLTQMFRTIIYGIFAIFLLIGFYSLTQLTGGDQRMRDEQFRNTIEKSADAFPKYKEVFTTIHKVRSPPTNYEQGIVLFKEIFLHQRNPVPKDHWLFKALIGKDERLLVFEENGENIFFKSDFLDVINECLQLKNK